LADKFRAYTQPEAFLSSGALDTFGKRIFWTVGPQFFSTLIVTILILASFIFLYQSKQIDKIANTPPMPLPTESASGYLLFDVNKNTGWGSDALLSAASRNPVVLTGGTPLRYTAYVSTYSDSPDKNLKKILFRQSDYLVYTTQACIEEISQKNAAIHEKVMALPALDCSTAGCTALVEPSFNEKEFQNLACANTVAPISANDIVAKCAITIKGENKGQWRDTNNYCLLDEEFVYTYTSGAGSSDRGVGLARAQQLEKLRDAKIKAVAKPSDTNEGVAPSQAENK
jgi:hypothetical protein